jgi:hypothetical protein
MVLQERHGVSLIRWFMNIGDRPIQTEGNRNAKSSGCVAAIPFSVFRNRAAANNAEPDHRDDGKALHELAEARDALTKRH